MEKIFKIEYQEPGGYVPNLEHRIALLFSGFVKVTEIPNNFCFAPRQVAPEQHQEEPKKDYCECKEPMNLPENNWCLRCTRPIKDWKEPDVRCDCGTKPLKVGDKKFNICLHCGKKIKPEPKPKLPPIPTTNMNSFESVWEYLKKLKEATE